jgi:SAM-dependent methyltransferase
MDSNSVSNSHDAGHGRRRPLGKRVAKRARRLLGLSQPYQAKRVGGTEQRWEMIAARLPADAQNLLDVGCNIGTLTRYAADAGLLAFGVDIDASFIRKARQHHGGVSNLSFMHLVVTPESIRQLPEFDVTLCLSVHHHWVRQHGLKLGWEMLATLLTRTRRRLFFEPASVRKKYKADAPDIIDLDRDSIIDDTQRQILAAAGDAFTIRCLGETPCLGIESFRLLFEVERR